MESRGQFIQQRVQALSNRVATNILISHITVLPGPMPAPNPPTALNPTVGASVTAGATSINIQCQTASGRLVLGDQFTISGVKGIYTVSGNNVSSMDLFTAVTFTPGLQSNVTAGTAITLKYVNQQSIKAYLSSSNKSLVEGGTITVVLKIIVPALNLSFVPNVGDRVILNGTNYLIGASVPIIAWGTTSAYELMVK